MTVPSVDRRRFVVAHHLFPYRGGSERLCAVVIDEIMRKGHEVAVTTMSKFNVSDTFREHFGIRLAKEPIQYYFFRGFLNRFGIFHRLFSYLPLKKAIQRFRPDSVFVDMEFIKPLATLVKTCGTKVVRYVHFPTVAETSSKNLLPEKYFRFPYNWYWKLYLLFQRRLVVSDTDDFSDVVCANSNFTRKYVERIWNRDDVKVVYSSVDVSTFISDAKKNNSVVDVGRFTPEKRHEISIHAISECENPVTLNLVGGLIPGNYSYFQGLITLSKELGVEDRVRFYPNAPFETLKRVLGSSKVFLHPIRNEHFGISTVEAMASGCVPICHASGGSIEVLDGGRHGFLFDHHSEIPHLIDTVIDAGVDSFEKMRCGIVNRARIFDESHFRQNILKLL